VSTSPITSIPLAQRSRPHGRRGLILGLGCVIASSGLALAVRSGGGPHPHAAIASGAHAAVDPRLILHARTSGVRGVLEGGVRVSGTLYPALPGLNTLRLTLRRASGVPVGTAPAEQVAVVVTMPGMAMPPVTATLTAHGRAYAGVMRLPMFGDDQARLVVGAPAGRDTGAIALTVPLDLTAIAHQRGVYTTAVAPGTGARGGRH